LAARFGEPPRVSSLRVAGRESRVNGNGVYGVDDWS
jgi:hypothetical protein